jgi:hypothetical protein
MCTRLGISLQSSREYQGREMEMQNAHERFGMLEVRKHMKDTSTRVRVHIDRAALEPGKEELGQPRAHLTSIIGGDSEIGAPWAAVDLRHKVDMPASRGSASRVPGLPAHDPRTCGGSSFIPVEPWSTASTCQHRHCSACRRLRYSLFGTKRYLFV